jgi:hypothetical protein
MVPGAARLQNERRTWWQIPRVRRWHGVARACRGVDAPIGALVGEAGDTVEARSRWGSRD